MYTSFVPAKGGCSFTPPRGETHGLGRTLNTTATPTLVKWGGLLAAEEAASWQKVPINCDFWPFRLQLVLGYPQALYRQTHTHFQHEALLPPLRWIVIIIIVVASDMFRDFLIGVPISDCFEFECFFIKSVLLEMGCVIFAPLSLKWIRITYFHYFLPAKVYSEPVWPSGTNSTPKNRNAVGILFEALTRVL